MSYQLTAFKRDPDDRLVFKIELTREQFERLLGERLMDYSGGGEYPVDLDFFIGETA